MSASSQLVLDLPARTALGRAEFFVSPSNRLALAQVDSWPAWPERRLAIAGPAGSGKTHLAHVWAARVGAQIVPAAALAHLGPGSMPGDAACVVEDADRLHALVPGRAQAAEEALFHLCERLASGGGSLMLTGRGAPAFWPILLPDLASRLRVATVATLDPPDDPLLTAVLVKLFGDRGIAVTPDLIRFLLARMDRSFEGADRLVVRLDRAGLSSKRPITLRLAAEVLQWPDE